MRASSGRRQVEVKSAEDVEALLAEGTKNRATGETKMNADSSRSHLILILSVESTIACAAADEGGAAAVKVVRCGKVTLVDLAGSEQARRRGRGPRARPRRMSALRRRAECGRAAAVSPATTRARRPGEEDGRDRQHAGRGEGHQQEPLGLGKCHQRPHGAQSAAGPAAGPPPPSL